MAKKETTVFTNEAKGKITLAKGFYDEGKLVKELAYDLDEVSSELYIEADARATQALLSKGGAKMTVSNFDDVARLYYGWASILAAKENEKYAFDFDNLKLIKGPDLKRVANLGSTFLADLGEESSPESSEQQ